jgi:mediator of RNA polymerase II transcription subunit 6
VETEPDAVASESKTQKEAIDLKELKRIDHILSSLKRKVI